MSEESLRERFMMEQEAAGNQPNAVLQMMSSLRKVRLESGERS